LGEGRTCHIGGGGGEAEEVAGAGEAVDGVAVPNDRRIDAELGALVRELVRSEAPVAPQDLAGIAVEEVNQAGGGASGNDGVGHQRRSADGIVELEVGSSAVESAGASIEGVDLPVHARDEDDVVNKGRGGPDAGGHLPAPGDVTAAREAMDEVAGGDDNSAVSDDGVEDSRAGGEGGAPAESPLRSIDALNGGVLAEEVEHGAVGDGAELGLGLKRTDPYGCAVARLDGVDHFRGADHEEIIENEGVGDDRASTLALPDLLAGGGIESIEALVGGADDDEVLPCHGGGGDRRIVRGEVPLLLAGERVQAAYGPEMGEEDAVAVHEGGRGVARIGRHGVRPLNGKRGCELGRD